MNTILIVGAGQLGSRHLQGVKTSSHELDIWVFDLNKDSLKVAEERYNQIESSVIKTVHFVTNLELIPSNIDVVIVATSSKPRAAIIKNVLMSRNVKYMILEKFLFPRLCEYDEISKIFEEKGVKAWVNCPRRMWKGYEFIKTLIDTKLPVEISYVGGEWGLCCNTIHYVDIFMFLNEQNNYEFNPEGLMQEVYESKRPGYIELLGKEEFITANGSKLILEAQKGFDGKSLVLIRNGENFITYNESVGDLFINGVNNKVPVHFQSSLSGILVDELLYNGGCKLVSYSTSAEYHKKYLSIIIPFVNKIQGQISDSCPIT